MLNDSLRGAMHAPAPAKPAGGVVVAGACGHLGAEVLRLLLGNAAFGGVQLLVTRTHSSHVQGLADFLVPALEAAHWPLLTAPATVGVVLFEPPRMYHQREAALWTPAPEQLLDLARWLRNSGVATLAIVLPHAQSSLPASLLRGLASLDEQAISALGFERLLIVRSAKKPALQTPKHALEGLAQWMLSITRFMVPKIEQPLRASAVAAFAVTALQAMLTKTQPKTVVAAPEDVWQATQLPRGELAAWVQNWLG